MGNFNKYVEIESNLLKKERLIQTYFNGETLEQRTQIEDIDYFDKYCGGENTVELLGNHYCPGAMSNRNFLCPYLSENKDHNGIRECLYHNKRN